MVVIFECEDDSEIGEIHGEVIEEISNKGLGVVGYVSWILSKG